MASTFDVYAYEPPLSLWELVKHHVPEHEQEEVKDMLGESLVEQSLELHEEVNTLLDIWRDYRDDTNQTVQRSQMFEPPLVRDRLKQEIKFFVDSLREKAQKNGRDPSLVLSRHNTEVIEYALDKKRPGSAETSSRPSTARSSRDGRETPLTRLTPTSDRASTLSDDVESMNDKLNVLKLDDVVLHLRETMEEEVNQLLRDIAFLQECLQGEVDYRDEAQAEEPSITELQKERGHLEQELLSDVVPKASGPGLVKSGLFKPTVGTRRVPEPLKPLPASPSSPKRQPGPMKASHDIPLTTTSTESRPGSDQGVRKTRLTRMDSAGSANSDSYLEVASNGARGEGQRRHSGEVDTSAFRTKHRLIRIGSLPASPQSSPSPILTPSPPTSANPSHRRPASVRLRKLVVDGTDKT